MDEHRTTPPTEASEADVLEQQADLSAEPGADPETAARPDEALTADTLANEADLLEQATPVSGADGDDDDYPHGPADSA